MVKLSSLASSEEGEEHDVCEAKTIANFLTPNVSMMILLPSPRQFNFTLFVQKDFIFSNIQESLILRLNAVISNFIQIKIECLRISVPKQNQVSNSSSEISLSKNSIMTERARRMKHEGFAKAHFLSMISNFCSIKTEYSFDYLKQFKFKFKF